ncbi:PREDICTED: syntaxin-1B-like [Amphimedon queenslandica]|uniref:t-SNARE coiled-coil homology domain-containing protein n=1 Tax=Amphimedon queenslandica TaxID=400682 RepID=A0AAN0JAY8_AMPQE|nr:PREDICTED: syntaxin-1B-like [Amphimedon queenslandica]XP_019854149.1 PREDICTED: syntaxin-1B-like [Amphimedon queenslandica]|eukprot:XP_019854148.1 PREDICTED: syntaxin-1B-like [Amphimedon queenslandica]
MESLCSLSPSFSRPLMADIFVDRLEEFRRRNKEIEEDENEYEEDVVLLEAFELNRKVDEIKLKLNEVHELQDTIVTKSSNQNRALKERHAMLLAEINQLSQTVQKGLKRFQDDIKRDELGPERNSAELRIKKSHYFALSYKLNNIMSVYSQQEEQHKEKCKDMIKRQLQIFGPKPDVSDEKIEEMLESNEMSIFTDDIIFDASQKKQVPTEIRKLEQNLKELHDMFHDFMLLILNEPQGDLADNIEHNVDNTAAYVEPGTQAIVAAARMRQSENRRLRWVICCVVL